MKKDQAIESVKAANYGKRGGDMLRGRRFEEIVAFYAANGRHPRAGDPSSETTIAGVVEWFRLDYGEGRLTADEIADLENIDGWEWVDSTKNPPTVAG